MTAHEVIGSREVYAGRVIRLRVDEVLRPGGGVVEREVMEHPGAVVVAALDGEGLLPLVRQYRHPVEIPLLELPAGTVEEDEEPIDTAERELQEETGLVAGDWVDLGCFFSSPGISSEEIHAYLARNLSSGPSAPEEDEELKITWRPLWELLDAPESLHDAKTLATVLLVDRFLREADPPTDTRRRDEGGGALASGGT